MSYWVSIYATVGIWIRYHVDDIKEVWGSGILRQVLTHIKAKMFGHGVEMFNTKRDSLVPVIFISFVESLTRIIN